MEKSIFQTIHSLRTSPARNTSKATIRNLNTQSIKMFQFTLKCSNLTFFELFFILIYWNSMNNFMRTKYHICTPYLRWKVKTVSIHVVLFHPASVHNTVQKCLIKSKSSKRFCLRVQQVCLSFLRKHNKFLES
jgi:hypothetical protein